MVWRLNPNGEGLGCDPSSSEFDSRRSPSKNADMVELVDTLLSKSSAFTGMSVRLRLSVLTNGGEYGTAGSHSLRVRLSPPPLWSLIPTAEDIGLNPIQCGFESHRDYSL